MDRSLWLLLFLRLSAWLRHWGRSFRSLKGLLLAVVGALVCVPSVIGMLVMPRIQTAVQVAAARQYGPLILLIYCVLNVVFSSGDRAIYYAPAEVNFLFSGPYRSRQILIYKVIGGLCGALFTSFLMALAFRQHAALFIAAFAGLFLGFQVLYLFTLVTGLLIATTGALAFNTGRRLVLLGVLLLVGVSLWPLGVRIASLPPIEILQSAIRSPILARFSGVFSFRCLPKRASCNLLIQ